MGQISVLHPQASAVFDEDVLAGLWEELGAGVAENILYRALEDIGARLSQIRADYATGDMAALRRSVRGLAPVAEQVGLPVVARCARDVVICHDRDDLVAFSATLCRLLRCAEAALTGVDASRDLSI